MPSRPKSCWPISSVIDPERLEDAVAHGAYGALAHALHEMTPEERSTPLSTAGC
ncbi:MAG: hypothetical protein R2911_05730 [Caldilineaceae bacterium]